MKKENTLKKILVCTIYLILALICILGIFFLIYKSSNRENDNIVRAQDNSTYLRNINPRFLVDFVNDEYVRFETVSSFSNPFENKQPNILQKIKYILGIKQQRKGIEISLIDVSYDTDLQNILEQRDINISEFNINRSFELISTGRVIGGDDENPVSKDTVISRNIYKGVDLEYQIIEGKGLKEEIVLNEIPEYTTECSSGECTLPVNRFLFKLQLDEGLEIKRSIDGSCEYPSGATYIVDGEGNYFAHFLPEFAKDALGNKTSNVRTNVLKQSNTQYIFEVILDSEWLLSNERVFPIRIDPSIVHDSNIFFDEGQYYKVSMDENMMLSLNSIQYSSGEYISTVLDLGSNSKLNSISWDGYSQATGDGEVSYSVIGLIHQEDFNDLVSDRVKWGTGSLQLTPLDSKSIDIQSQESTYFTLELWSNIRYIQNEQYIFKSNLGNLKVKDGVYIFEDIESTEHITQIQTKYNSWEYIAVLFDIENSISTIYINEFEENITTTYPTNQLQYIQFTQNEGYIDTLRIYDRLVPKNELLANSQYSNIYMQYSLSNDLTTWDEWYTKSKYLPLSTLEESNMTLTTEDKDISTYELLTLKYLTDTPQSLILGESKFVNGVDEEDITRLGETEGEISLTQPIKYLDLLFTPNTNQEACILSLGALQIHSLQGGKIEMLLEENSINTKDMYILNNPNILSISFDESNTYVYINGNILEIPNAYILNPTSYSKGVGCTNMNTEFDGEISDVRISTQLKSKEDILQYSNILNRTYTLKPSFLAQLQTETEVTDMNDKTVSIIETESNSVISNLYVGDTLVITENEYTLSGEVLSVENDTGLVTVREWEEGSTLPETGFTTLAKVLKWETEYIPLKSVLSSDIPIYSINLKSNISTNIKDLTLLNLLSSKEDIYFENTISRYLKYRLIYTSLKPGISSSIASVNIDFESGGPEMEQILRHGQWFNEGSKQGFWWIQGN